MNYKDLLRPIVHEMIKSRLCTVCNNKSTGSSIDFVCPTQQCIKIHVSKDVINNSIQYNLYYSKFIINLLEPKAIWFGNNSTIIDLPFEESMSFKDIIHFLDKIMVFK